MNLFDFHEFFERLIISGRDNKALRDKIDTLNAGSLERAFEIAEKNGINLLEGEEVNGYVKNNNKQIADYLAFVTPNFNPKQFVEWTQMLFTAVAKADSYNVLDEGIKPFVNKDFEFESTALPEKFVFSICYLHLFSNKNGNELLQVYITVMDSALQGDRNAEKYFVRFTRPSQFKVVDMRRVKTTSCPNCGGSVVFIRGNTAKCEYCDQLITFEEYGWTLWEIEKITEDTEIINFGIV